MKLSLTLLSMIVIFLSCKKSNDLNNAQSKSNLKTDMLQGPCPYACTDPRCQVYVNGYCSTPPPPPPVTIAPISNPNNPYEYIGVIHNAGMDYALGIVTVNTPHSYT